MNRQQPQMSPHPGHHSSSKEMQLWQQHLLYKQRQELQRQHQLHQQAAAAQSAANQLPALLIGIPINNASNHMLQNCIISGDNMNRAQGRVSQVTHCSDGLVFSNDHVPQQLDQSLHGTPVSSSRGLPKNYPRFQGFPNNVASDTVGSQFSSQEFLGKNLSVDAPVHCSSSMTSLDPTEQKILFGSDDDSNCGALLLDNPIEGNDQFGAFSSLQSGSWSALMQEAVQASSSDKGLHEEWCGLSFQRTEPSILNPSAIHNEVGKHQPQCDNNFNNLRPFPLCNDANFEGGFQAQTHLNEIPHGVWSTQPDASLYARNVGNLSNGMESVKLDNYAAAMSSTNLIANQDMNQCSLNRQQVGENAEQYKHQASRDQGFVQNSQFALHDIPNMGKGYAPEMQKSTDSLEEPQHRSVPPRQISQNMLELLHKADNSRDYSYGNSGLNTVQNTHVAGATDVFNSLPHHHQSLFFQGSGLRSALPSQQQQEAQNHDKHSQASLLDSNRRQLDSKASIFDSSSSGNRVINQLENTTFQDDVNSQIKHASFLERAQTSLPTMAHGLNSQFDSPASISFVNKGSLRPNVAASNAIPSNVPNYSILQQMQATKCDSDESTRDKKKLKRDTGDEQNVISGVPLEDELGTSTPISFCSDAKLLINSSRQNIDKNAEGTAQHDIRNQTHPLTSASHFMGQYRYYKQSQILAMYGNPYSSKVDAEVSTRVDNNNLAVSPSISASSRATGESSPELPLGFSRHETAIGSKKRKAATFELLPWHLVVSLGVRRLQSISNAERDWAQATNRLIETVEDEPEIIEDGSLMPRARRRLFVTSRLLRQLLPSIPAPILASEVTSACETVTYFLAKAALGDACSMIIRSEHENGAYLDKVNRSNMVFRQKPVPSNKIQALWISEKCETSKMSSEVYFSKIVEDSIERSRKLESVFSRLEKSSVLDIRLVWQEVERFSLINRLGKFHGRRRADGGGSSPASQNAPRKLFPQRFVTAFSIPGNVPQGVICLSL